METRDTTPVKKPVSKSKGKHKRGRNFSVKAIKNSYKRARSTALKKHNEKASHIHSGVIPYENTDNDCVRSKYDGVIQTKKRKTDSHLRYNSAIRFSSKKRRTVNVPKTKESNILLQKKSWEEHIKDGTIDEPGYDELINLTLEGEPTLDMEEAFLPYLNTENSEIIKEDPVNQPESNSYREEKTSSKTTEGKKSRKTTSRRRQTKSKTPAARGRNRENYASNPRVAWTPFNTNLEDWMKDIVAYKRIKAKVDKVGIVCDFLRTSGSVQSSELVKKKGPLQNVVRNAKKANESTEKCITLVQNMVNQTKDRAILAKLERIHASLLKQQESNIILKGSVEDFASYAKSAENRHNLQESFLLNMKSHMTELDKKIREVIKNFLTHVPSHKYTNEDHEKSSCYIYIPIKRVE